MKLYSSSRFTSLICPVFRLIRNVFISYGLNLPCHFFPANFRSRVASELIPSVSTQRRIRSSLSSASLIEDTIILTVSVERNEFDLLTTSAVNSLVNSHRRGQEFFSRSYDVVILPAILVRDKDHPECLDALIHPDVLSFHIQNFWIVMGIHCRSCNC